MTEQRKVDDESIYQMAICRRNLVLVLLVILVLVVVRPKLFGVQEENKKIEDKDFTSISKKIKEPMSSGEIVAASQTRGIDVSHYQGVIDWSQLSLEGLHFVFIKATQGLHFVDPTFSGNTKGAEQISLLSGAYHFFEPKQSPVEQAEFFLEVTSGLHQLPPVLDIEIAQGLDKKEIVSASKQWLEKVEAETGCRPIIYSSLDFWQTYLSDDLADYQLWVAEYQKGLKQPTGSESWIFWQETDSAHLAGIKSSVDLNLSKLALTELEKLKCPINS
ncbi:MAG: GH25 family lysozyme [Kangiellaceae bacterium]|nr:GH25 family lysozyme [Kangiellaceae bacterium]MCW9017424.1 GH25 family lysozyme [Kangiellaceae bacterium]